MKLHLHIAPDHQPRDDRREYRSVQHPDQMRIAPSIRERVQQRLQIKVIRREHGPDMFYRSVLTRDVPRLTREYHAETFFYFPPHDSSFFRRGIRR